MNDLQSKLEQDLNHFDINIRRKAVAELATLLIDGKIGLSPEKPIFNLHCHTFYSFNAYGYSPSRLVWLAKKEGFQSIGMVDFDVLDGVDEFYSTCDTLGVRGTAGMETRVYIPQFASREINSPGEPGIFYYMGVGFPSSTPPPQATPILDRLRARLSQRNVEMVNRINPFLDPLSINYQKDVLPLTPAGNATERHILAAYLRKSNQLGNGEASFWSSKLGLDLDKISSSMADAAGFQNLVRSKLMKKGGVGYIQPDANSFPQPDEVNQLIIACGAIPCATWLDGTSPGEQAMSELLELLIEKGVGALNIIPDRNWNIKDPQIRETKVRHLYQVVKLAENLHLPIIIGTEMNSFGQKIVDEFTAPELAPVLKPFIEGSQFIYGHTVLQRTCGLGYQSDWANTHLNSREQKNEFYQRVGALLPSGRSGLDRLSKISSGDSPKIILQRISS